MYVYYGIKSINLICELHLSLYFVKFEEILVTKVSIVGLLRFVLFKNIPAGFLIHKSKDVCYMSQTVSLLNNAEMPPTMNIFRELLTCDWLINQADMWHFDIISQCASANLCSVSLLSHLVMFVYQQAGQSK